MELMGCFSAVGRNQQVVVTVIQSQHRDQSCLEMAGVAKDYQSMNTNTYQIFQEKVDSVTKQIVNTQNTSMK